MNDLLSRIPHLRKTSSREFREDLASFLDAAKNGLPTLITGKQASHRAVLISPEDASKYFGSLSPEELAQRAEQAKQPATEELEECPACTGTTADGLHVSPSRQHPDLEEGDEEVSPEELESLDEAGEQMPESPDDHIAELAEVATPVEPQTPAEMPAPPAPQAVEVSDQTVLRNQGVSLPEEQVMARAEEQVAQNAPAYPVQPLVPAMPEIGRETPIGPGQDPLNPAPDELPMGEVPLHFCEIELVLPGKVCMKGADQQPGTAVKKIQVLTTVTEDVTGKERYKYPPINICQMHLDQLEQKQNQSEKQLFTILGDPS